MQRVVGDFIANLSLLAGKCISPCDIQPDGGLIIKLNPLVSRIRNDCSLFST